MAKVYAGPFEFATMPISTVLIDAHGENMGSSDLNNGEAKRKQRKSPLRAGPVKEFQYMILRPNWMTRGVRVLVI